ncbi:MAG: hypothetical protein R2851_00990 [Caldilineaceae bacterium]
MKASRPDGPVPEHAELVEDAIADGDADGHTLVAQGSHTVVRWTFSTHWTQAWAARSTPGAPGATGRRAHPLRAGDCQGRSGHGRGRRHHRVHVDRHNLVPLTVTNLLVEDIMPAGGGLWAARTMPRAWSVDGAGARSEEGPYLHLFDARPRGPWSTASTGSSPARGRAQPATPWSSRLGDTSPPPDADPIFIENGGIVARWTQDRTTFGRTSNAVRNRAGCGVVHAHHFPASRRAGFVRQHLGPNIE